ncbi:MAG TPA: CocE/NonD family hydrolase [Steroidobacteraceae bacterium]|nr:CocE/NonD family hydrolase [Steroidobacteraceae bacterium]
MSAIAGNGRLQVALLTLGSTMLLAAPASSLAQSAGALTRELPPSITSCTWSDGGNGAAYTRRSIYVPAADGRRLAVDIFLPKRRASGARLPTLYTATRYWRASRAAPLERSERPWIALGYAVVNADVRGTGASFGQWYIPYSPQEARDVGYLANWIARQRWSNGKVVMSGNSYLGTTALMGPAFGTPAIRAVAAKFADFDMYTDLLWPGGVPATALIERWGDLVHRLDLGTYPGGVRPVDGRLGARWLAEAIADHSRNADFARAAHQVTYKDQRPSELRGLSIDDGGVYRLQARIMRSGVPIFGWGSWLDSGIAQGLLNRFMTWTNPQLTIIGPWTHGARADADVFDPTGALDPTPEEQARMIYCFLNSYVTDRPPLPLSPHGKRLVYFTMGANAWHTSNVWPIAGTTQRRLYFDTGQTLSTLLPSRTVRDTYAVDFSASAGPANRWATQAGGPRIDYGDRAAADRKLLTYTARPLKHDLEITGQPIVTLRVASSRRDGSFFVYLEDVSPRGRITYLTEGVLRALDRKLSKARAPYETTYPYRSFRERDGAPLTPGKMVSLTFPLEATSVLIRAGHRLRVAISGADRGSFARIPPHGAATIIVWHGGAQASFIDLPTVPIR